MVASSAPLDQFIVRNPLYFFDASPEHALIDPDNLHILVEHIKCAAFELPFLSDEVFGRHDLREILSVLAEKGIVHLAPDSTTGQTTCRWTSEAYPANAVSLRSVSSDNFVVVDTTREPLVIGETDFSSGPATLHPKAIYIVEAKLFQVEKLDFDGRKAFVKEIDCDYYTDAITYTRVTVLDTFAENAQPSPSPERESLRSSPKDSDTAVATASGPSATGEPESLRSRASDSENAVARGGGAPRELNDAVTASHGEVQVVSRVVGFKKIKFYTNENIGSGELDLPEQQMHTTSYWLTVPADVMTALPYASDDRRDGVVGLSFAMRQVAQLLLMCDGHDIGISIETAEPTAGATIAQDARIFIYDNYPGGIGFSEPLFRMHDDLLDATRRLIAECPCENGCPGCVGPIGNTGPLAKTAALGILNLLSPQRSESGEGAARA